MKSMIWTALLTLAVAPGALAGPRCAAAPAAPGGEAIDGLQLLGPTQVGEVLRQTHRSEAFAKPAAAESALAWRQELTYPGASYIAPHFSRFALPPGAELIVRAPDGSRSWTYTGYGKAERPLPEGFWGIHIPGDTAVVELYSREPLKEGVVVIDSFAHGFEAPVLRELGDREALLGPRAICGADDSDWAACYQSSEPSIYDESRAVVRLLINGTGACTGWLVGDEGHVMTNNHCIGGSSSALNTDFEFMAEGSTCGTNCASFGACPGTVEATSSTLIQTHTTLDYTLVQLPTNVSGTYGFMQLRETGAVNGERIYIPGHPAAWGKRFAVESSHSSNPSGFCEVDSLNQSPCIGGSVPEVGYFCDTQGGSSGSPVLGYSDHCVVALHHCANCQNRGVPIENIIANLGGNLPDNALCGDEPPPPPPPPGECLHATDFESGANGWSQGSSSCSTGDFVVGTPDPESNGGVVTQVGGGAGGSANALFTAPNPGGAGTDDVDNGTCEALSPNVDASGEDAVEISLDYFHGQRDAGDDSTDGFTIEVLNNGAVVGSVVSFGDVTNNAAWTPASVVVSNPGTIRLRVRATDGAGPGDLVEGGVDNVLICPTDDDPPPPDDCTVDDDFEGGAAGWFNDGASTCSTGAYTLGTPTQVSNGGVITQVGGDHTSGSGNAIFTATNSSAGVNDVDGGVCILGSPTWSVAEDSELSVWYFHGQRDAGDDPSGDFFRLEVSTNGGASFTPVVSIGDVTSNASWTQATASIPAGSSVKLRDQASDGPGPGDLVEAGIDDLRICPVP